MILTSKDYRRALKRVKHEHRRKPVGLWVWWQGVDKRDPDKWDYMPPFAPIDWSKVRRASIAVDRPFKARTRGGGFRWVSRVQVKPPLRGARKRYIERRKLRDARPFVVRR